MSRKMPPFYGDNTAPDRRGGIFFYYRGPDGAEERTYADLGQMDGDAAVWSNRSKFYNPEHAFEQEYREAYDEAYTRERKRKRMVQGTRDGD